jgi:hypothetical protein
MPLLCYESRGSACAWQDKNKGFAARNMLAAYCEKFSVGRQAVVVIAFVRSACIEQLRLAAFDGDCVDFSLLIKQQRHAVTGPVRRLEMVTGAIYDFSLAGFD